MDAAHVLPGDFRLSGHPNLQLACALKSAQAAVRLPDVGRKYGVSEQTYDATVRTTAQRSGVVFNESVLRRSQAGQVSVAKFQGKRVIRCAADGSRCWEE